MGDETALGVLPAPPSVLDGFRGNKVYGRLITTELPTPPPKLLTRKPGRCSEPLEKAQKAYEDKSLLDKLLTPKDAWGNPKDQLAPKLFKQQCEQWPDQMPEWFLDEQQQRLNDHLSGRISLLPEESLRLRRDLSLLNDIYRPGPRYEASLSTAEQAYLDERNLRFGNSLSMALLGPVFGGPAAATRALGGTEQQVAAANQMGAIILDLATTRMATGSRPAAGQQRAAHREYARGAPLEPQGYRPGLPSGTVVSRPLPPRLTRTKLKEYLNNVSNVPRDQLVRDLESAGLKIKGKSPDGRFMELEDSNGVVRAKIHPPDKVTLYQHLHIYDSGGGPLDVNLNRVDYRSPDAHIPIQ